MTFVRVVLWGLALPTALGKDALGLRPKVPYWGEKVGCRKGIGRVIWSRYWVIGGEVLEWWPRLAAPDGPTVALQLRKWWKRKSKQGLWSGYWLVSHWPGLSCLCVRSGWAPPEARQERVKERLLAALVFPKQRKLLALLEVACLDAEFVIAW